ncbi:pyruvate carboxylase [Chitinophaga pendula]|uniref:pyruvate carboxylase n=1 Tax=Chitinophaga TaxID=79328 RepID=UPI000BAF77EC|nr:MULTISPECIES: pyruvate carboxylase [Chitinophaga]ASZ12818.1 pyruvate carboxylase [Chitinophaga sp. MD30]UCJ09555.1 pyruvate carboxylase [Chitinophaga pendula]
MSAITLKKIQKLLVANRGEIAVRVLRAAAELRIPTVAIFTYEDRYSLHRYKADEAYQIGKDDDPLKPYLDIEAIIHLAKAYEVDAIHPGYGFLSENVQFARRCREEGIIFVGPTPEVMAQLGDKVAAKMLAREAGVPLIEDSEIKLETAALALQEAKRIGFPVMLKAAAGGGGRGMRVVRDEAALTKAFTEAKSEAGKAFGDDTIFIEKFIEEPKHIEVQLMGDNYGNIVHLYERDCSVQRRFQKVVEIAPSPNLPLATREEIYEYALRLAHKVNYNNVGTVEFLVDRQHKVYFIEVNPRIQVEHTVTEEVTGIDIVRSQILIAGGHRLSDPEIFLKGQEDVRLNGFAIQCRITTEDPENNFTPDYGTVIAYRNAGGFGIRLDEGSTYSGVKISPFFDSMLVKVTAWGRTLSGAAGRLHRTLREFRIRGVKTNISFLENVISHDVFRRGNCTVAFLEQYPELFKLEPIRDRATRTLMYLADVTVNGHPDVKVKDATRKFRVPQIPAFNAQAPVPPGSKQQLEKLGRDDFARWLRDEKPVYFTDTTYRDAHQSLLATRVRTKDIMAVAEGYARHNPQLFSMEVWGGATFDVSMRFLHECPWRRLQQIRKAMPNLLLQMLFRGSNAVGYSAYPENLIAKFIEESAANGIDVFRIFDSLNWVEAMAPSIRFVREYTPALAQAAISYTGDILKKDNQKYTLQYYIDLAKRLEDAGAHMLAIKDMAGLLKPQAATVLIGALREAIQLPIVLHTHDTASVQAATYLKAIEAGINVVDASIASLSGLTAQPNLNALVAILEGHERSMPMNLSSLNEYSNYWEDVREFYYPFESDMKAGTAQIYENEIPGGQYSNLRQQAESLGLGDKLETIKKNYAVVNELFGDIVKVTPSSKVVGDMALFMTANGLTKADVLDETRNLAFPASVTGFFKGELGVPYGGFPATLQRIVLKDTPPLNGRPNEHLPAVNFEEDFAAFRQQYPLAEFLDYLSYQMFPKVFDEYYQHAGIYGNVEAIPTPAFFYGLKLGEEILITLSKGKTIIVKLLYILPADEAGMSTVVFELNGYTRRVQVRNKAAASLVTENRKVSNAEVEIGAPLQGKLSKVLVQQGEEVRANTPLFIIEAMKMETTVTATRNSVIKSIHLKEGAMVQQDDVIVELA